MNDISRMSRLKQRSGLNIASTKNVTSEYITMVRISKIIRKAWNQMRPDFERKYSKMRGYNYTFVESFIPSLQTILTVRLQRLNNDYNTRGQEAIEDYLLSKMEMSKNNLVVRGEKK